MMIMMVVDQMMIMMGVYDVMMSVGDDNDGC